MGEDRNNEYNQIPVYYCTNCLSLLIRDGGSLDFCDNCGSTDIEQASLDEYDELHKKRFGTRVFYKE